MVNTITTLVGFFFANQVFFNLFASTEIVVQAIRFLLERSSKESSGTLFDAKKFVEIRWWMDKRKLKKEGAEN